jgi:hypothetical protein
MRERDFFASTTNSNLSIACHLHHEIDTNQKNIKFCPIGLLHRRRARSRFFLTGDSMAMALTPAFDQLKTSGLYASIWHNCRFLLTRDDAYLRTARTEGGFLCSLIPQAVYEHVRANRIPISKVFIAGHWKLKYHKYEDLEYTIRKYSMLKVMVYLIQEPPIQPVEPVKLYKDLFSHNK